MASRWHGYCDRSRLHPEVPVSYRVTPWPALVRDAPVEARQRIETALTVSEGRADLAATALGLTTRQLLRHRRALGVAQTVRRGRPPTVAKSDIVD